MKKIINAIDSFKACLTSAEAGKAADKGINCINPFCHTSVIPIGDGG
ncbi:glycerate kinase, partial [Phocaeicola vulgatus]